MCLAVPMELVDKNDFRGTARLGGVSRDVNLMLVPDVQVGDYVIIHAGCAISVLSQEEAKKTLEMLKQVEGFGNIGGGNEIS